MIVLSLFCLADWLFFLFFKMRLRLSHLRHNPVSTWDSAKWPLLILLCCIPFLWNFRIALAVVLSAKWPHPLVTLIQDILSPKLSANFPKAKPPEGEKLFSISGKPHIVFLSLESFGHKPEWSPHFENLKKQGVYFPNFYATGLVTYRALVATLFGVTPAHRAMHLEGYVDFSLPALPKLLPGYQAAHIQGASLSFNYEAEFFKAHGFSTVLGKAELRLPGSSWGVFDEHLFTFAADFLKKQTRPTFLNLYTITNHHPYIHPKGPRGYEHTFAYTDACLAKFIEIIDLKNTLLFIFGDHGLSQGELTKEALHVPLLILGPVEPQVIDTLSSHIDLFPTVLDLFDINNHHSLGKSLLRPSNAPIYFSHPFDHPMIASSDGSEKEYFAKLDTYYGKMRKIKSNRYLNLSNQLIMDEELMSHASSDIAVLSLSCCHLLTNEGIGKMLALCPNLERLYIDDLEITGENWPEMPHLYKISANNCPNFKEKRWESLLQQT